jgi:hypothetical protein
MVRKIHSELPLQRAESKSRCSVACANHDHRKADVAGGARLKSLLPAGTLSLAGPARLTI